MNQTSAAPAKVIRYVGYDKATGRVVHVHSKFNVPENRFVEIPIDELTARFSRDSTIVGKLAERDPSNLHFLKVELGHEGEALGPVRVDLTQGKLVKKHQLKVTVAKTQLVGDGQDSVEINIVVVDAHGHVVAGASGPVKVISERGRLADRGGMVQLAHGKASTTLTSVNETIHRVRVSAKSLDGAFVPGHVDLEFL